MPRTIRRASTTGIYHALLRGINQQRIFEDDDDREFFLRKIEEIKEQCGITLFAYCLMSNHLHLLIRQGTEPLSLFFRRLGAAYVYRFNHKYDRSGHLFQDRFKSEPVEDDAYFLAVLSYIFQNPVRAGICREADGYRWSSLRLLNEKNIIIDWTELFAIVPEPELRALAKQPLMSDPFTVTARGRQPRYSDEEAVLLIKEVSGAETGSQFQKLEAEQQCLSILALYERRVSVRQMARLSGLSKGVIERWLKGAANQT
jgi:REP element-mobilizing transposase RayT